MGVGSIQVGTQRKSLPTDIPNPTRTPESRNCSTAVRRKRGGIAARPLWLRISLGVAMMSDANDRMAMAAFLALPGNVAKERLTGGATCLSSGKLERNIGECAGSGGLSHSPAERLCELEFDCVIRGIAGSD